MERKPIKNDPELYPETFRTLLDGAVLYDSSSSPEARVIFIDKEDGFYLKRAVRGSLKKEAELTEYFSSLGLGASLTQYLSLDCDWLLTERVAGEDACHPAYLSEPKRLASLLGELLRELHEKSGNACPEANRRGSYIATAKQNYAAGLYDPTYFTGNKNYGKEDVWRIASEAFGSLENECLIHGDFCLPNVILDAWHLSGYIDLGGGGIGDRHIDLFWGAWTLKYNLKTDEYRERFFDAYGRDKIDFEKLTAISAIEAFG